MHAEKESVSDRIGRAARLTPLPRHTFTRSSTVRAVATTALNCRVRKLARRLISRSLARCRNVAGPQWQLRPHAN
jgi:hypothetical protein